MRAARTSASVVSSQYKWICVCYTADSEFQSAGNGKSFTNRPAEFRQRIVGQQEIRKRAMSPDVIAMALAEKSVDLSKTIEARKTH
jgi:hypothetical protein